MLHGVNQSGHDLGVLFQSSSDNEFSNSCFESLFSSPKDTAQSTVRSNP